MDNSLIHHARRALRRMAYPLVRILLRYGVSFEEFIQIAKTAYVEVAASEFSLTSRPASKSRIALLTGLNRREVAKVLDLDATALDQPDVLNRSARIVSAWLRNPNFQNPDGTPLTIPIAGSGQSLEALVRECAADIPVKAVLRELLNAGVVKNDATGLTLLSAGYIPSANELDRLELLGTDVAALLTTIDHNLQHPQQALFQRKVSFSHVSPAGINLLQTFASSRGQELLLQLDKDLAEHQAPENQKSQFAGMGIYVFAHAQKKDKS